MRTPITSPISISLNGARSLSALEPPCRGTGVRTSQPRFHARESLGAGARTF